MLPSSGTRVAHVGRMVDKGLAGRVADLEAKVGRKSLEEQFRAQAEMLDERFVEVHERLDGLAADVGVLKIDVSALKTDVGALKTDVSALKTDVSALKKDMAIVRGGMGIILRKLR
jgi:formyltetrahydrofolate synthetase